MVIISYVKAITNKNSDFVEVLPRGEQAVSSRVLSGGNEGKTTTTHVFQIISCSVHSVASDSSSYLTGVQAGGGSPAAASRFSRLCVLMRSAHHGCREWLFVRAETSCPLDPVCFFCFCLLFLCVNSINCCGRKIPGESAVSEPVKQSSLASAILLWSESPKSND